MTTPPAQPMSFVEFLVEAVKKAFHRTWLFIELLHGIVFLALYAASYRWHSLKEDLPLAALVISIMALVLFLVRLQASSYWIYRKAEDGRLLLADSEPTEIVQERDRLRSELALVSAATAQILHQGGVRNKCAILDYEQLLYVEADGSLRATKTVEFRALANVSAVESKHGGDHPVKGLSDVGFSADCEKPHRIVPLPDDHSPVLKRWMLVFLPGVRAGQTAKYTVRWSWPGLWKPLIEGPSDNWRHVVDSAEVVPSIRFRFKVAKSIPPVTVRNLPDGVEGKPLGLGADGYFEYLLELTNVAPGTEVEIRLAK